MMFDIDDEPRPIDENQLRYSQAQMNYALQCNGTWWFLIGAVAGLVVMAIAVWNS